MPSSPGRPKGSSDARQQLIDAARGLFIELPYEKVSTRLIAQRAGVNSALIRYYFTSKAGLYEQMLREALQPIRNLMQQQENQSPSQQTLEAFMRAYYQVMAPNPDLPRLIFRVMSDQSAQQHPMTRRVLAEMIDHFQNQLFNRPELQQRLREGVTDAHARISIFSLLLMPFLLPPDFFTFHKIPPLQHGELMALLEHNIDILRQGLFTTADGTS